MAPSKKSLKRKKSSPNQTLTETNGDEDTEKSKHLNYTSTNSQLYKKKNIMKACCKVSHEAYEDYKKRFQLLYVPACYFKNNCDHDDKSDHSFFKANIKQISLHVEQVIKTEFKNSALSAALEICVMCMTPNKYLPADVLRNVVGAMMNAHEDLDSGYEINYLLKNCQHTLLMHFNLHPPCVKEEIKICYDQFINAPYFEPKSSKKQNESENINKEGIVSHCFSRLLNELKDGEDGTIIKEENLEIPYGVEGVRLTHWKREQLEVYGYLVRTERIERCMLVLESIIYLMQTDLALYHARLTSGKISRKAQRPLMANLLWPDGTKFGDITDQCNTIMVLFASFIHLQYPERHIKTMVLWMNAVAQTFYMYSTQPEYEYPFVESGYILVLIREFHKLIENFPDSSILKILQRIEPTFIRYVIGLRHIQHVLQINNKDILNIIIRCFKTMSLENYCVEDCNSTSIIHSPCLRSYKNSKLNLGNLMDCLSKKCKSLGVTINVVENAYPKLDFDLKPESKEKTAEVSQNHIIHTLFITFIAYIDAYSIKKFIHTLKWYNEDENNCGSILYKPVGNSFGDKYSSIINSLQELSLILSKKQCNEPLQKLADLLKIYFPY